MIASPSSASCFAVSGFVRSFVMSFDGIRKIRNGLLDVDGAEGTCGGVAMSTSNDKIVGNFQKRS
jgi:hypothetical protein